MCGELDEVKVWTLSECVPLLPKSVFKPKSLIWPSWSRLEWTPRLGWERLFFSFCSRCVGGTYFLLTMTGMHKEPQFSWDSSEKELHELGHRSEASSSGDRLSSWGSDGLPVTYTPWENAVLCPRSGQSPVIVAVSRGKWTLPATACSHTCPGCPATVAVWTARCQ